MTKSVTIEKVENGYVVRASTIPTRRNGYTDQFIQRIARDLHEVNSMLAESFGEKQEKKKGKTLEVG